MENNRNNSPDNFSRRQILTAAGVAGAALPLVHSFPAGTAHAQTQAGLYGPLPTINISLPSFSVAERDRRWAAVRSVMAEPQWDLDAIITCFSDEWGNNARYLTQVAMVRYSGGGPQVVFPRDPDKTVRAQVGGTRHRDEWISRLNDGGDWLADGKMEILAESGADDMISRLAAEGLDRRGTRIGLAKLAGSRFDRDGLVSATWLDMLRSALPNVEFLAIDTEGPDSGPIQSAAMVKSAEEQMMIRRAVAANQVGLSAMVEAAGNGATRQADMWWAAFTAMIAATGDDLVRLSIGLDEGGNATLGEPVIDPVRVGQLCTQEISAAYQGYGSQINHTFYVGPPSGDGYEYYSAAIGVLTEIHENTMAVVRPGQTTYGELLARMEEVRQGFDAEGGGVVVHSGGIGFARPRLGGDPDREIVLQPGHSFDFKPSVILSPDQIEDASEENRDVQLGESYLITETGVERYGDRLLRPIATHA